VLALNGDTEEAIGAYRQGRDLIANEKSPDNAMLSSDLAWFEAELAKLQANAAPSSIQPD
jgi:hypothetical protein